MTLTLVRVVWHVIRYTVATCISTVVAAILPVSVACVPILLAIMWVLAWGAGFVLYALTGDTAGIEIEEPLGIVLVPVLFLAFGIASAIISLLLAAAFGILVVLPVSLITELICWRLSIHVAILRLGSFLLAGLSLGIVLEVILIAVGGVHQTQASPLALLGVAVWLLLTCIGAVFTSGLVLMTMSLVEEGIVALGRQARTWITETRHPVHGSHLLHTTDSVS